MTLKHIEDIKKGRRYYGAIYAWSKGQVYIASRKRWQVFRHGEVNPTQAVSKGTISWAIDNDTLLKLRRKGIKLVGIYEWDSAELYLTTLEKFAGAQVYNYSGRGGALQRYLSFGVNHPGNFKIRRVDPPAKLRCPRDPA